MRLLLRHADWTSSLLSRDDRPRDHDVGGAGSDALRPAEAKVRRFRLEGLPGQAGTRIGPQTLAPQTNAPQRSSAQDLQHALLRDPFRNSFKNPLPDRQTADRTTNRVAWSICAAALTRSGTAGWAESSTRASGSPLSHDAIAPARGRFRLAASLPPSRIP